MAIESTGKFLSNHYIEAQKVETDRQRLLYPVDLHCERQWEPPSPDLAILEGIKKPILTGFPCFRPQNSTPHCQHLFMCELIKHQKQALQADILVANYWSYFLTRLNVPIELSHGDGPFFLPGVATLSHLAPTAWNLILIDEADLLKGVLQDIMYCGISQDRALAGADAFQRQRLRNEIAYQMREISDLEEEEGFNTASVRIDDIVNTTVALVGALIDLAETAYTARFPMEENPPYLDDMPLFDTSPSPVSTTDIEAAMRAIDVTVTQDHIERFQRILASLNTPWSRLKQLTYHYRVPRDLRSALSMAAKELEDHDLRAGYEELVEKFVVPLGMGFLLDVNPLGIDTFVGNLHNAPRRELALLKGDPELSLRWHLFDPAMPPVLLVSATGSYPSPLTFTNWPIQMYADRRLASDHLTVITCTNSVRVSGVPYRDRERALKAAANQLFPLCVALQQKMPEGKSTLIAVPSYDAVRLFRMGFQEAIAHSDMSSSLDRFTFLSDKTYMEDFIENPDADHSVVVVAPMHPLTRGHNIYDFSEIDFQQRSSRFQIIILPALVFPPPDTGHIMGLNKSYEFVRSWEENVASDQPQYTFDELRLERAGLGDKKVQRQLYQKYLVDYFIPSFVQLVGRSVRQPTDRAVIIMTDQAATAKRSDKRPTRLTEITQALSQPPVPSHALKEAFQKQIQIDVPESCIRLVEKHLKWGEV